MAAQRRMSWPQRSVTDADASGRGFLGERLSTGLIALMIPLTIGAPAALSQAPKRTVPAPWTIQQEAGSQLVPAAQAPFAPRLGTAPTPAGAAQSAQPSTAADNIEITADSGAATQDGTVSEPKQQRKPREAQPAPDSAAALNRQELFRITGDGYRVYRN